MIEKRCQGDRVSCRSALGEGQTDGLMPLGTGLLAIKPLIATLYFIRSAEA